MPCCSSLHLFLPNNRTATMTSAAAFVSYFLQWDEIFNYLEADVYLILRRKTVAEIFFSLEANALFWWSAHLPGPQPTAVRQCCCRPRLSSFQKQPQSESYTLLQSVTLCGWAGGYNWDQPVCQASYIVQEYRGASVSEAAGYSTRVQTDRDLP